jgi:tetratricopeptide (TPR) repeat protein
LDLLRLAAAIEAQRGDLQAASDYRCQATERGGAEGDYLDLARTYQSLFQLERTLTTYERAAQVFPTETVYREWVETLLAYRLYEEAALRLDEALRRFPQSPGILESRAALAAAQGRDADAVRWIRDSWSAGADRIAWTRNSKLSEVAHAAPYSALLDGEGLLRDISELDIPTQVTRLKLLSTVMAQKWGPALARLLASSEDTEVRRMALDDLGRLGPASAPFFAEVLTSRDPGLKRLALYEMRRLGFPEFVPVVAAYVPTEAAPGNRDFAETLMVLLQVGKRVDADAAASLAAIPATNTYRYLALYRLADIEQALGHGEKATVARAAAQGAVPPVRNLESSPTGLEAYWDCMQRLDIEEMLALLDHHRYVERVDGRLYGLPENDFDDVQNLTVAERLFLRSWAKKQGLEWPTEGQLQYPREIRHTLRQIQRDTGMVPDCSGILVNPQTDPRMETLQKDGNELKIFEDTGADNEVNIVVNPYAQQYIVSTSNAYSSSANESYRSSDWGNTWTHGAVLGSGACDPVSYYNRNQVLYHCWLTGGIYMAYSANNGQSWTQCSASLETSGMDRQDVYIDTFTGDGGTWPISPCIDKIYVGYHLSGAQKWKVSTGASAPFCNTWSARLSLTGNGASGTIGTAIASSIGKTSGNGTVIYVFSRYASTGQGIYYSLSTDCGATMGTPALIKSLNNGGLFEWGIPSTNSRKVYVYPQADTDRQPLSAFRNNIYVTWNDLSSVCTPPGTSNTTCNSDIYVAKGVPNNRDNPTSWTWTNVNLTASVVGTDSYTDEFYPSLSVDQADGSIYVAYYRTNSGTGGNVTPRKTQVHYVMLRSIDGGSTWSTVYQVTQTPTDETGTGANLAMQWGDYTWVDTINGVSYPNWTDRREGADEDIWSGKVCSEPAHWVERGASPTVPPTTCANGASAGQVTVTWTAPDLYWGDGGESNAARKYQLWVDGALATDNILWTSTSTTYTASNCTTSHTYQIRAVNQCGVTKNYGTTTFTPSNCSTCTAPGAPNLTAATGMCAGVNLTWTAGSGTTLSYNVYRFQGACGGAYAKLGGMPVTGTSYSDTSAVAGTSYAYVVRGACDAGGATESVYSNCRTAARLVTPAAPGAPALTPGCTNVNLSWTAVSGATDYEVWRNAGANCTGATQVVSTTGGATTYNNTGLPNNSQYSYYILAKTASCSSGAGTCATTTTLAIPAAPGAPALTPGCTNVNLSWTAISGATDYEVWRNAGANCTGATQVVSTTGGATTYNDTGRTANTQYSYAIRAKNTCGTSANGTCATTTTLAIPAAPGAPTLTPGCTNVGLSWTAVSGATDYEVWRNQGANCTGATQVVSTTGGATTYNNTGLASNTQYSYAIRAKNTCGTSGNGSCATTTTVCTPVIVYSARGAFTQVTGDGDGVMEAGEKWSVQVTLANTGDIAAANVTADLSAMAAGDGITVCDNPGAFGAIAAGGTANTTYTFVVNAARWYGTYPCGSSLTFNVVNKATSTPNCTCANQLNVFSTTVGATAGNETATQVTTPLIADNSTANSNLGPAFTLTSPTAATLSYTSNYTPGGGTTVLFGPDDDPFGSGNWAFGGGSSQTATHCSHSTVYGQSNRDQYMTLDTGLVSTVGYTNIRVTFDRSFIACESGDVLTLSYYDGSAWQTGATYAWDDNTWHCGVTATLPAGAEGVSNFQIRFYINANNNDYMGYDYISITGDGGGGSGTWTDNARVQLVDPSATVTTLKDYGTDDGSPYNVLPYYSGPGTYILRLSENLGGTATVTLGSMNVTKGANCSTGSGFCVASPPLRVPHSVTPSRIATANQGVDGTVTWDVSNCASADYHILYGMGAGLSTYTTSGGKCDMGTSGTYSWPAMPDTSGDFMWFLIVGDNDGTTEGSWGFSTSGERNGTGASNRCGCAVKDTSTPCATP